GELPGIYAQADVFVFPSLTDTFGNTILEALACGVPVAAFPVTGPLDIIGEDGEVGALHADLKVACLGALSASREKARDLALQYSWEAATQQFINNIRAANGVITPKWKKAWQYAKTLPKSRKAGDAAGPMKSGT
ncbi:glycosyltransferase, partial [Rhizobium sp. SEMIA 4085]|uniref:glycosyltransferase n=1 Tax=Rhizobium sp. SEMIA 4085 TaxID=2137761 RepID=UPI0014789D38